MLARTIREYEHLPYGDGAQCIPLWAADRLARVAGRSMLAGRGGSRVLAHGRKSLQAGHVVGVIAAEGCTLEILPKIDGLGDGADGDCRVRDRLIHMLAVARDIKIDSGRLAQLGLQKENLLEVLIGLFAAKLAEAVRRGMPRSYVGCEEDLPALRGSLDVMRQFTTFAGNPSRLACRYDTLSHDIPLNRAMKAAVGLLLKVSRSAANHRRLRQLAFDYADIGDVSPRSIRWETIILDRTQGRWRELTELARLLLGGRYQTTASGTDSGFSLLFEMNMLFEAYVARILRRALLSSGYSVVTQGGRRFCLTDEDGKERFQTRPDIMINKGGETALIIDTKWKRIAARIDDPKQGVSQADVYQMMAYGRLYRSPDVMLLYPQHGGLPPSGLTAMHRIAECGDRLSTATVDLANSHAGVAEELTRLAMKVLAPVDRQEA